MRNRVETGHRGRMNDAEYRAAYEGRIGADRMRLHLSIIPHPVKGDMYEVEKLRAALLKADSRIAELEGEIERLGDYRNFREDYDGGHA